MIAFLRPLSAGLPLSAADYCNCIQSVITINVRFQELLNLLIDEGLTEKKQWDLAKFLELYRNLNKNTHKYANRGYTPDELVRMEQQGWPAVKKSAPAGQLYMFEDIRAVAPRHFLLVPGVGAQGGSLQEVCKYGMINDCGLLVNSSRGIIYASTDKDFAEVAAQKAKELQEQMAIELEKLNRQA